MIYNDTGKIYLPPKVRYFHGYQPTAKRDDSQHSINAMLADGDDQRCQREARRQAVMLVLD